MTMFSKNLGDHGPSSPSPLSTPMSEAYQRFPAPWNRTFRSGHLVLGTFWSQHFCT